jgi:uncharacterized protein YggT (Ycf19 family)
MTFLLHVLNALRVLVVSDALFTFALAPTQFPRSLTKPLLDPVYAPWRETVGRATGHIDLAPLVALAILYVVQVWIERKRATAGTS